MENNLVLLIVLVLALSQAVMAIYFFFSRGRSGESEAGQDKEWEKMHEVIKKGEAIIGNAELEAIRQEAESKQRLAKFERSTEDNLTMSSQEVLVAIKEETARAGENYKKSLALDLEQLRQIRKEAEEEIKKSINAIVSDFDQNLAGAIKTVQDQTQKDLVAYQRRREKQIDDAASNIVDRAVELYLGKKLDKKEQMQLIFEALERAKAENVWK